jgi:hypothetical protein
MGHHFYGCRVAVTASATFEPIGGPISVKGTSTFEDDDLQAVGWTV